MAKSGRPAKTNNSAAITTGTEVNTEVPVEQAKPEGTEVPVEQAKPEGTEVPVEQTKPEGTEVKEVKPVELPKEEKPAESITFEDKEYTVENKEKAGYDALGRLYAIGYLRGLIEAEDKH